MIWKLQNYDRLTTELRKLRLSYENRFSPLKQGWKRYDLVTKTVLTPQKTVDKLRSSYENRFVPFKKREHLTIDLRLSYDDL